MGPNNSKPRQRSRRSSALSFLEHGLSQARISKSVSSSANDTQNSFGLNLLHEPAEPRIDFIFVHGLGGGSRKTWSLSNDPNLFWPREWLHLEPGFEHVRIHSYGYESQWNTGRNFVNIHDFGQNLIAAIHNSPCLRRDSRTRLVFVAHSMGGIVVKKAYLLAMQDPNYSHILERIHSMFFLATPHRGADSAQLLKNILRLPGVFGSKAYVGDITPSSTFLQDINDTFRHVYRDVKLWSFYETVPMRIGFVNRRIVEKHSAILGLPFEHVQAVVADHRHICKFEHRSDKNYVALYHAFLAAIDDIIEVSHFGTAEQGAGDPSAIRKAQEKRILKYLSVSGQPEIELNALIDKRTRGSCNWLIRKSNFRIWFEGDQENSVLYDKVNVPKFFWLSGRPGVGKSTLAAHIATYIRRCGFDCGVYFFHSGDKMKSSIVELLKSIAYQMACVDENVRESLYLMAQEGEELSNDNYEQLWRKLFQSRIFLSGFDRPYYWVIDGLDECKNLQALFPLLSNVDKKVPLRVMVTSRYMPLIETYFRHHSVSVLSETVTLHDSLKDIELHLCLNAQLLPVRDKSKELIRRILERSNGSFLWVSLVLITLQRVRGWRAILKTLDSIPPEMDGLYAQMLEKVVSVPQNVDVAMSIFRWTMYAIRPLTVDELEEALYLEFGETFETLSSHVEELCGHLVYVDAEFRVQPVHQTVRTFFNKERSTTALVMDKIREHGWLAKICLACLSQDSLMVSRVKPWESVVSPRHFSAFTYYAAHHFSDHLNFPSESNSAFSALYSFLKTPNVLTWVEILARKGNLSILLRTAKNLRAFMVRCGEQQISKEAQLVDAWAKDLIHMGALFGRNLLLSPTSAHFLIPPLCPGESQIHKQFGNDPRGLTVIGKSNEEWNDRLTCFLYGTDEVSSISHRGNFLAVGLLSGIIMLYRSTMFELIGELEHGEPVERVACANTTPLLVCVSAGRVSLWDLCRMTPIWRVEKRSKASSFALCFNKDDSEVLVALDLNISVFQVSNGQELSSRDFYGVDKYGKVTDQCIVDAYFCTGLGLMALIYRSRPIIIWNLERDRFQTRITREDSAVEVAAGMFHPSPEAYSVAFHPSHEVGLLAAAYDDGELVLHNLWKSKQVARVEILVHTLAASPDGRNLAAGDCEGVIYLFEFESLKLIYKIISEPFPVQDIVFASSSLRFFDTRGDRANVWEPSALVRKDNADDASFSEEVPFHAPHIDFSNIDNEKTISALVAVQASDYLFCGRSDGSVAVYDKRTSEVVQELYSHKGNIGINLLDWNFARGILTSADFYCGYISRKVWQTVDGTWHMSKAIAGGVADSRIVQILTSPSGKQLLLATARSYLFWNLEDSSVTDTQYEYASLDSRKWVNHPFNQEQLLFIEDTKLHVFDWTTNKILDKGVGISLGYNHVPHIVPIQVITTQDVNALCLVRKDTESGQLTEFQVWDALSINPSSENIPPLARYGQFSSGLRQVIGLHEARLLFLDFNGWICSIGVGTGGPEKHYTKHFFIPYTWYSTGKPLLVVTNDGSIILGLKDGIMVFKGGLDFEERVEL